MSVHCFSIDALVASAWKNGGGVTREIACVPEGATLGDFQWRVSVAHIAQSGPFSAFPGIDRVITLLTGAGVRLHSADGAVDHRLDATLAPFAFPGECPIDGELLAGPCEDLNVMVRRSRYSADVQVLRASAVLRAAAGGVLLAGHGGWKARSPAGETITLAPGGGVWWSEPMNSWNVSASNEEGVLVAVLIHERAGLQT
jgi:uncharacterized protein